MSHRSLFRGALALCCALLLVSAPAWAATPQEIEIARNLFGDAEKDEHNGRWSEALKKLERVVVIKETAGVRFHIAVCQEKLGMLAEALKSYERAEVVARDANATDVLEMVEPEIERLNKRVGGVSIRVPDGVGPLTVHIDHAVHSNLPRGEVIRLDPGTHQIIVKIDGKVRLDRLVSVEEGRQESVVVKDWRKPKASPTPAETPPKAVENAVNVRASSFSVPTAAWISFGTAGALGVGGYLAYARADNLADESADVCAVSVTCDPARAERVRQWDVLALTMWTGAAVGVGIGVALTKTHDGGAAETAVVVSPNQVKLRTTF